MYNELIETYQTVINFDYSILRVWLDFYKGKLKEGEMKQYAL